MFDSIHKWNYLCLECHGGYLFVWFCGEGLAILFEWTLIPCIFQGVYTFHLRSLYKEFIHFMSVGSVEMSSFSLLIVCVCHFFFFFLNQSAYSPPPSSLGPAPFYRLFQTISFWINFWHNWLYCSFCFLPN